MIERRYNSGVLSYLSADLAYGLSCVTSPGAGGSNGARCFKIVSRKGQCLTLCEQLAAVLAVGISAVAPFRAGGSDRLRGRCAV